MKAICLIILSLHLICCHGQRSLPITTDKTSSLIFPYSILHVDRGTKDVLVETVQGADHILLVKAAVTEFTETNLSVITADGSLYTFLVCYEARPSEWVWHLSPDLTITPASYARSLLDNPPMIHGVRDQNAEMILKLTGIYIKDDVLYCQLNLANQSFIDYDIDFLGFNIRDRIKGKRTAVQETEVIPLYITGNIHRVKGHSQNTIVVALEKFTIPDDKHFLLQVMEKNGGRHLSLKLRNSKLLKALPLPAIH